jgi:hypothetical protein
MIVEVDIHAVPPGVRLREPEQLTSLSVRVVIGPHAFIEPDEIVRLAGSLGEDEQWRRDLRAMVDYARDHGWTSDTGSVRAHIELDTASGTRTPETPGPPTADVPAR